MIPTQEEFNEAMDGMEEVYRKEFSPQYKKAKNQCDKCKEEEMETHKK